MSDDADHQLAQDLRPGDVDGLAHADAQALGDGLDMSMGVVLARRRSAVDELQRGVDARPAKSGIPPLPRKLISSLCRARMPFHEGRGWRNAIWPLLPPIPAIPTKNFAGCTRYPSEVGLPRGMSIRLPGEKKPT